MRDVVEAEKVFKIITNAQIKRLAFAHGLDFDTVADIRQELAFELVEGTSTFDPAKGKFENWLRSTISNECKKARCGRVANIEDFVGEDCDAEFLTDAVSADNFEVARHNDAFDMNQIHAEHDLDDPFWQVAFTREGWAEHHGLSIKQADTLADRLADEARELRAQGMTEDEIIELFRLENRSCGRQRKPKQKRTDDVVDQPELF